MREEYKTLKFTPFAYLLLDGAKEYEANSRIYPATTRLSTVDKSSLVLTFNHNTLALGRCYTLVLDKGTLGVDIDDAALQQMNKICTTKC